MSSRTRLTLILALAVLIYVPGLTGGFVFDDYFNILTNSAVTTEDLKASSIVRAAWSGTAGPLKRPIASLSFAANYALTGAFPMAFKLTNLAIHALNGLLLYWLACLVLSGGRNPLLPVERSRTVSSLAALLWLVHPLNLTSVLYVVQRMNSLSALFTLAALIAYCSGRNRQLRGGGGKLLLYCAVPAFFVLGVLSKENALLCGMYCAVIEFVVFRFGAASDRDRRLLQSAYVIFLVAPLLAGVTYLLSNPDWLLSRYSFRPFTLVERLLTEARVLWWYAQMIVVPRLSDLGLFHDDITISTGLFKPVSTALSVVALAIAVVAGFVVRRKLPVLTFAVFWFITGHLLESTIFSLELVHEHRNYLPSAGVLLALVYGVYRLAERIRLSRPEWLVLPFAALFAMLTALRAADWSDPLTLATIEAERHPRSFRAVYELGRIQFGLFQMTGDRSYLNATVQNLERSGTLDPNAKRPYFGLIKLSYEFDIERNEAWLDTLLARLSHGLIHPTEASEFQELSRCFINPECRYPRDLVLQLFGAALGNPKLDDRRKAQVLVSLSAFYINALHDMDPAVRMVQDAVSLDPDLLSYRRMLLQLLLMADRKQEARIALAEIQQRGIWRDAAMGRDQIARAFEEYAVQLREYGSIEHL